jgi:AcrR family transcriptional regulator
MSRIAEETGIGRATLYKYFPDVESILLAWHERQIAVHLEQLVTVRDQEQDPVRRLHAVLETYALVSMESRGHHDNELAASMHRDQHVHRAEDELQRLVQDLVAGAVESGTIRDDIPPGELATYCLHALVAARTLPSKAAVRRLVRVTLDGLQPP